MKKRKNILFLVIALALGLFSELDAQDANFSQFFLNQIYYNPAYAGSNSGMRTIFNHRTLWSKIDNLPRTYNISLDISEEKIDGGAGLIAMSDFNSNSYIKTSMAGGIYAHRITIDPDDFIIQAGLQANVVQKTLDYSGLIFSDQISNQEGITGIPTSFAGVKEQVVYPDFSAGIISKFNVRNRLGYSIMTNTVGVAFHHLTRPNVSFTGLTERWPMKINIHGYSIIPINQNRFSYGNQTSIKLAPAFMYERQGKQETFALGLNSVISSFYTGVWFRNKNYKFSFDNYDALIFMAGVIHYDEFTGNLYKIGYSYDMTVSQLGYDTGGSHEISLVIEMGWFNLFKSNKRKPVKCPDVGHYNKKKKIKKRIISCPDNQFYYLD